jgi:SAM-dependent methyltransferase
MGVEQMGGSEVNSAYENGDPSGSGPRFLDGLVETAEAPSSIKRQTQALYTELDRRLTERSAARRTRFMNFGYRPVGSETPIGPKLPPLMPNRDSMQLLFQVVDGVDLGGRDVLEVGSGRGGNLWAMAKFLAPRRLIGVDLTPASVAFAQSEPVAVPRLLTVGDAEALPVRSGSADVVVNIETSCCYPNVEAFYREVARVLRVGGTFAYADLMPVWFIELIAPALAELGLAATLRRDISANVAASRRSAGRRQASAFTTEADGRTNLEWVGADGSFVLDAIEGGEHEYFIMRFVKEREVRPGEAPLFAAETARRIQAATDFGNALLDFGAATGSAQL